MSKCLLKLGFILLSIVWCLTALNAQTQEDINGFIAQGQKLYTAGDLAGAAIEFENVLMIDRQNFSARVWLTQIYADQKSIDKARKLLREARLQAPDHPRVLQLQKLLGSVVEPSVNIRKDPVVAETLSLIGSGTRLRPFGLVIPEEKVKKEKFDPDLLVFADVEVLEEPQEDPLDMASYFEGNSGPLADVFKALENDGINAALDIYLEKIVTDPSLASYDDKGLIARGNEIFAARFVVSAEDEEARFYYGCLQYINGLFAESLNILEPLRNKPGQYAHRLRPVLAALDKWQDQEKQRILMARKAEEERLAREAWEKAQEEKKKESAWASVQQHRADANASGTAEGDGVAAPPSEASKLHDEGYDLYKRGKLDEAIEKYQAALGVQQDNPMFNYHMGLAWTDKGLAGDSQAFDRAISSFQRVVSLAPNDKLAKDSQAMIRDIDAARKTLGE